MWTDLIAIKDVGQFICSQFSVRVDTRTCPAHSHLPSGYRLKLKVPLPLGDSVRLLCPEDSYLVPAGVLKAMASCRVKMTDEIKKHGDIGDGLGGVKTFWNCMIFCIQSNTCYHEVSWLTALLIWRLNVVAIANEGADSIVNTVSVGFLSSLVQQVVRYQTRVSLI